MENDCFLAFDTSCYTTSIALVSDGNVLIDKRIMLNVEKGSLGLRQSEAVFQHIKNLKIIFTDFSLKDYDIKGVACSEKPCPAESSYMPVFCAGESFALSCASVLGALKYPLTHQHGHIYSSFFGNTITEGEYIVFHVSGGTLDILKVSIKDKIVSDIIPLGGKLDITCGQLIDRAGVAAGLKFPAGEEIEKIYTQSGAKLPVNVSGLGANLSGAETKALRLLKEGKDASYVCSGVIDCAAETLVQLVCNAAEITGIKRFIFTGGVICNRIIREMIYDTCCARAFECILTNKIYSGDNACGLALAAQIIYTGSQKCI